MRVLAAALALAGCAASGGPAGEQWDTRSPASNADRAIRLFKQVCVNHLGDAAAMGPVIKRTGLRLRVEPPEFGRAFWTWSSPLARITAHDRSAADPTDACKLYLSSPVAPSAELAIAALRRAGLVRGASQPSEFGAEAFRQDGRLIFVRYDVPGTEGSDGQGGLMLLIRQPAG